MLLRQRAGGPRWLHGRERNAHLPRWTKSAPREPRHPTRMHRPHFLLVAPFPGMFARRAVAYWVLLHLLRGVIMLWLAAIEELRISREDLLPGGNPLIPALVVVLGMLQARWSDENLYLANLGYGRPVIAAYLLAPAAALETVCTVARTLAA